MTNAPQMPGAGGQARIDFAEGRLNLAVTYI